MDLMKKFIFSDKNITKDAYVWNMASNLIFAFQSVILLMVLTRTVGLEQSGVFTIAYVNANLFLFIGKYGVRNFQVSDVKRKYSFKQYVTLRVITVAAMFFACIGYSLFWIANDEYTISKGIIMILMCVYKIPDAIEDVFFGEYQRQGRLDVAAKCMTIRLALATISFIVGVVITKKLLETLIISIIISFVSLVYFIMISRHLVDRKIYNRETNIQGLMKECFPIFAGTFMNQYICNAPKYAIDANLSDEIQACYGFIAMPVFVIGLFSTIIFNPVIHKMAEYWEDRKYDKFIKRLTKQFVIIIVLTIISVIGAWLLGIPVLSIVYNTDLSQYKTELIILLVGGCFLAVANLLIIILTIMRAQNETLIGYLVVALFALLCSNTVVSNYGVRGASWLYTLFVLMLVLIFITCFTIKYKNVIR